MQLHLLADTLRFLERLIAIVAGEFITAVSMH